MRRRTSRLTRNWISAALLLLAVIVASNSWRAFAAAPPPISTATLSGPARIIDGDTVVIAGAHVRLWGVDAPERNQRCADGAPGRQATAALDQIIGGQTVACIARDRDRYGRTVAECRAGGVDLGARMVREGWAWDYTHYSHGRYQTEEDAARAAHRGVWAMGCEPAWEWRHAERG